MESVTVHRTSFLKMASFWETYIKPAAAHEAVRVLDIGSRVFGGGQSYKDAMDADVVTYVGLDLEHGRNVDLVPENAYVWDEIANEEFNFCISGQAFEHNPYFWVTFAEIARVLKQGGMLFVIAPGRGHVHRYPADCWRFFPDSWAALCRYCGLELVESYFEDNGDVMSEPSLEWCDSCVIARKPEFASSDEAEVFYRRIGSITATIPEGSPDGLPGSSVGACMRHYLENNEFNPGLLKRGKAIVRRSVKRLLPARVKQLLLKA